MSLPEPTQFNPKEGPLVPSVEHLEGVNGDPLPTEITKLQIKAPDRGTYQDGLSNYGEVGGVD